MTADPVPAASRDFPDLRRFFAPRSVAFIGATEDQSKFGGRSLRLLLDFGYRGALYPINPKRNEVFGVRCFPALAALPEVPDHVAIMLPAAGAVAAVEECGRLGVPFATVFSSGFAETGTAAGQQRQRELVAAARRTGIRVMGPNCNGLANFVDRFALTSTGTLKGPRREAGRIGIASQSGGLGQTNVMWRAQQTGLGISYAASTGNDADLDLLDYIAFMLEDPHTEVVLAVAERFAGGAKLRAVAERAASLDKPIVMLKIGRTHEGSRAALSHTGSVTGSDDIADAALRQFGILRVDDSRDLYEVGMLLQRKRHPSGHRAAATCISGGNVVLAADLGATLGIEWPAYAPATQEKLREVVPDFGSVANPTDLTAASIGRDDAYAQVCRILLDDPNVDLMIPIFTIASSAEVRMVAALAEQSAKPMAILWTGRSDDPAFTPETLIAQGHAVYRDTMPCLRAVAAAMRYGGFLRERAAGGVPVRPPGVDVTAARALLAGRPRVLTESACMSLLALYGLPVAPDRAPVDATACSGRRWRLGFARDPVFGPVLRLGMAGECAEVFGDVACCLPPVTARQARQALGGLRAHALLQGAHGTGPADIGALVDCIVRLSWLAADLGDLVAECHIDPLQVGAAGAGAQVGGARAIVAPPVQEQQ